MRFICISDTHTMHRKVQIPKGDVLLHAGDIGFTYDKPNIKDLNEWAGELMDKGIVSQCIMIAGNHDWDFEKHADEVESLLTNWDYLFESSVETDNGVKVWGAPWQPEFGHWAFNVRRGDPLRQKWTKIPEDADIVITHGPPYLHGDRTLGLYGPSEHAGCVDLSSRLHLVQPAVSLFGHIHEGYGVSKMVHGEGETFTWCINASSCTIRYKPINPPIVFDLEKGGVAQVFDPTAYDSEDGDLDPKDVFAHNREFFRSIGHSKNKKG